MGYPVVELVRDYEAGTGAASQARFLLTPGNSSRSGAAEAEYTWWVPLSLTSPARGFDTTAPSQWLDPATAATSTQVDLDWAGGEEAVILNVQQTGFYRVNYDLANWGLLAQHLLANHRQIHRINRAQILDDSLNLARASLLPYPAALQITEYLTLETDFVPWSAAITGLGYLEAMMQTSPGFGELRRYLLATLQPVYRRLGLEEVAGESYLDQRLRVVVAELVCRLGDQECAQHSAQLLADWQTQQDPDASCPLPLSTRTPLLCTALGQGSQQDWDWVW